MSDERATCPKSFAARAEAEYERMCHEVGPTPADGRAYDAWHGRIHALGRLYCALEPLLIEADVRVAPLQAVAKAAHNVAYFSEWQAGDRGELMANLRAALAALKPQESTHAE